MRPIEHVRRSVLGVTQAALAKVAGVSQATVSRWEKGDLAPSLDELQRIRAEAMQRGIAWDDSLFFEAQKVSPICRPEDGR